MADRQFRNSAPACVEYFASVGCAFQRRNGHLFIPVEGDWLPDMGFRFNAPVRIVASPGIITIQALNDPSVINRSEAVHPA